MPDFNRREHPDDMLLEEARMAAESDWEEEFVADLLKRRNRYAEQFTLTNRQRDKLKQIAYGEQIDDDTFDRWSRQ